MSIRFNDELDVTEFTQHSRSILDDLFWEDDEIAEFRHHAFLIECGLANEDEEEDEIVSLEGFELSEEKKNVVTQMHSSLPVIQFDFDILESKQSCLKSSQATKPTPTDRAKIPSLQSTTSKRVAKFQELIDRQRQRNQATDSKSSPLNSPKTSPLCHPYKKKVLRSPPPPPPPQTHETIQEVLEEEEKLEEDQVAECSGLEISIQGHLERSKQRDEISHTSDDSLQLTSTSTEMISPIASKFIVTSSPVASKKKVEEKRLRRSTRKQRLPSLTTDGSDRSVVHSSDGSPLDAPQQSQVENLVESSKTLECTESPKPNSNNSITIELEETPKLLKKKSIQSNEKSPKKRSSKVKKLLQETMPSTMEETAEPQTDTSKSPKSRSSNVKMNVRIPVPLLSSMDTSTHSIKKTPKSREIASPKGRARKKNLSLSSTETAASTSDSIDEKPIQKRPSKKKSNEDPGTPRSSKKKTSEKPPPPPELLNDIHACHEAPKSDKKRSSKSSSNASDLSHSFSSMETSSSSLTETPKSPKTKSTKTIDEPVAATSSKKKSLGLKKSTVSNDSGAPRPPKKKSMSMRGSISDGALLSVSDAYVGSDVQLMSNVDKATESIDAVDTQKSPQPGQTSEPKIKRQSATSGHSMMISIKKKTKKKQDAPTLRRRLGHRSLSSSHLVEMNNSETKESLCQTVKRSNSVRMP